MKHSDYNFFQNKDCPYFPCHNGIAPEDFNCLFCYCPLYALKDKCGGNFRYLDNGIKDCSACTLPHCQGGYDHIMERIDDVVELGKK